MSALKFTYRSGQRPLDGFTLKRGVGQGGFGEVYFAVSDGGKEVALKLLRGHTDAELRGIGHCLNLKHANLVHLYDLRSDPRGEKWVVMEYVFGESLAQVINRHPNGLPGELIREWFSALARGVSYLHDQGVVHRDLKPANIFIEHGHLKVGDYGLSRRMSSSERGAVTRGVGTPHYMAPEIKNGNYGRSIDVYACGVILFEMLTGRPVFDGETPAEVLMKHQLDAPDLGKVPAAMKPVLERALEKDPAKRYQSMMEFAKAVEAVFGVAAREASGSTVTLIPPLVTKVPTADTVVDEKLPLPKPRALPVARPYTPGTVRERLTELAGGFALTPLVAAACTLPFAFFHDGASWTLLGRVFVLSTVLTWALLLVARLPRRDDENPWGRRAIHLGVGVGVGVLACWLDGWSVQSSTINATSRDFVVGGQRIGPDTFTAGARYLFYFGLATAACRWWVATDRKRKERVRIFPVIAAGFWGTVLAFIWPWGETTPMVGIAPLVIAAITVQAASPWSPPAPAQTSRSGRLRVRAAFG